MNERPQPFGSDPVGELARKLDPESQGIVDRALRGVGQRIAEHNVRPDPKPGDIVKDHRGTKYVVWRDGSFRRVDKLVENLKPEK